MHKIVSIRFTEGLLMTGTKPIEIDFDNFSIKIGNRIYTLDSLYPIGKDHVKTVISNALYIARLLGISKEKTFISAFLHYVMTAQAQLYEQGREQEIVNIPRLDKYEHFLRQFNIYDEGFKEDTPNPSPSALSAYFAYTRLHITDRDILLAIAHHSHGAHFENYILMSDLEKVIMLAYYIGGQEEGYEQLAMKAVVRDFNLDYALLVVLTGVIQKLLFGLNLPGKSHPIPSTNLIKIWSRLASDYIDLTGVFGRFTTTFDEVDEYLLREHGKNRVLAKLFLEGKFKDQDTLLNALLELEADPTHGRAASIILDVLVPTL